MAFRSVRDADGAIVDFEWRLVTPLAAALVACARRGLTDRKARLELDGGDLTIEWRESDSHVIMTGPASVDFTGVLP